MPIVYCSLYGESLKVDQCFNLFEQGNFSASLQSRNFYKVKFTDTSRPGAER